MKNRALIVALASLTAAAGASADPIYTVVNPPPSGELGHAAIFANIYGGVWVIDGSGPHMIGGVATASRVSDEGVSGILGLPGGGADDVIWSGIEASVVAKAKYAGDNSIFGWFDDTQAEPVFQPIFNTGDLNMPVTISLSGSFRWALNDTSTGRTFTSRPTDNAGAGSRSGEFADQLVTYHVTGLPGVDEYVLFWEDRIIGQSADYDYNDSAIVVQAVPTPATGVLAAFGMLGMASRRRRA